jgi:heme-degrading monooxygenase HmoA
LSNAAILGDHSGVVKEVKIVWILILTTPVESMPFVSITRLRVRSWRYLPGFFVAALRSRWQARNASGNLAVSVLRETDNTFWTRSLWVDEAAMKAFMASGAHRAIMPRLLEWCDEASVTH